MAHILFSRVLLKYIMTDLSHHFAEEEQSTDAARSDRSAALPDICLKTV